MDIKTTIKQETIDVLGLENIQAELYNKMVELDNRAIAQTKESLGKKLYANTDRPELSSAIAFLESLPE